MKKYCFLALATIIALITLNAQSFKIITVDGDIISYSNDNVESIEFISDDTDVPDRPTDPGVIKFDERFKSITPAAGIIDLGEYPNGIGRISIEMNGTFEFNSKCPNNVTITNAAGVKIYDYPPVMDTHMQCYLEGGVTGSSTSFTYVIGDGKYIEPGSYQLTIPSGFYREYMQASVLGGKVFSFTIPTPAADQTYTASPALGVVKSLYEFEFTFQNYSAIKMSGTGNQIAFLYKDGSASPVNYMTPNPSGNKVKLTLNNEVTEPGVYSVVIPAGTLTLTETATGEQYPNKEIKAVYQIEGTSLSAPLVGDFYYSDGTWSTSLLKKDGVEPIGIVFYVGVNTGAGDNASYYTTKNGSSMRDAFHGYVVSIKNAAKNGSVIWSFFDGNDKGCDCSSNTSDFRGYTNSVSIKTRADKDYKGLSAASDNFPAAYYAIVDFDKEAPAPASTSGWFLPSAGQLDYIMNQVYYLAPGMPDSNPYIEKSLKTLKDNGYNVVMLDAPDTRLWSSTEEYDSSGHSYRAYRERTGNNYSGGVAIEYANKNRESQVRPILAF